MIQILKSSLAGRWEGEGYARYPSIQNTSYMELLEFTPDIARDVIHFQQKTWYLNDGSKNGETVFWDTGFIIFKDEQILMNSVQLGGRVESLIGNIIREGLYRFDSVLISNDPISVRSQRIFKVNGNLMEYELNLQTTENSLQNHLTAKLKRQ